MRCPIVVVLVAGCFSPAPPEGAPCGDGLRPCPASQTCNPADNRCYADLPADLDAPLAEDGRVDAPTACTSRRLLAGGLPIEAQGWTVERAGAGTITYGTGMTTLTTTTNARQLIVLRDAFPANQWQLRIAAQIVKSGGCTPSHAAAAFMAGFHPPLGDTADRARMLCMSEENAALGDGSITVGVTLASLGLLILERTPNGGIRVTVQGSGSASVSAGGFTSNGTIAIGDQSTEPGLDATINIASVDLVCP